MSPSSSYGWQNLSDLIFTDIIMMLGLKNIEEVQKCRKVCHTWNMIISQVTKYKKEIIKRNAESLVNRIRADWILNHFTLLPEIISAASLAHHGMLGSVDVMSLLNVNLSSVANNHLTSLASCMMKCVYIHNVSNCDLVSILDSLKCTGLRISCQTLSSEETRALVRAMESRVEEVELGEWGDLSLDITALTQYSGQGMCRHVYCMGGTALYREVRSWAERINWLISTKGCSVILPRLNYFIFYMHISHPTVSSIL